MPSMAWRTICASCTGRKASGSLPLWMRSRSRMSLMRRTRRSELVSAMRSRLAALSLTSPRMPEESRPSAPRMEVSGRAQLVADGGDELVFEAVEGVALADVAEAEHGAGEAALVGDGREHVLGGEGAAVGAEDGVFAGGGLVAAGGAAQRALVAALAVGRCGAVEQFVDRLAGEAWPRPRPAGVRRRGWQS